MKQPSWESWIQAIRDRDGETLADFWSRYGCRLVRLADNNLQEQLRRRVDAEDMAQSAIRTFLRRVKDGQFQLDDDEQLWSLLCAITLNKVRMAARFHLRQKRGLDREHALIDDADLASTLSRSPESEDAAVLIELVQQAIDDTSDEQERQVLQYKLEEMPNSEIASRVGCSERTVRRMLERIRQRLEGLLQP